MDCPEEISLHRPVYSQKGIPTISSSDCHARLFGGPVVQCYSSFDLSSIYAVKYHLTTRIRLYQLSFPISTIPGLHYHFPAFSDLPVI